MRSAGPDPDDVHLAPEQVKVADVEAGELARPQYGVGQEADQQAVDRLGGILLGSELGYLFLGEEGGPERGPVLGLGGRQRHPVVRIPGQRLVGHRLGEHPSERGECLPDGGRRKALPLQLLDGFPGRRPA